MIELILPFLGKVLPDILRRVLPAEKMTEEESAQLAMNLQLELAKADWNIIQAEFADRNSARDLAKADIAVGNAWTGILAAIVRPLWGIGAFIMVVYYVASGNDLQEPIKSIIETVIMFYFGGRVAEKLTPTISGIFKK